MYKILIISILAFCASLTVKGQNLFLIGEKSYPCTNAIILESNSNSYSRLNVFLAKDGNSGLIAVSRRTLYGDSFIGKLIIYLDDGNVVTCNENVATENVDDDAKALYNLTSEQMNKLKIGNIHTVKYTLDGVDEGNFSASNTGVKTNAIISGFFDTKHESNSNVQVADLLKGTSELEESEAEPFAYVEQMPTFPGGQEAMYMFIYQELEYPTDAKEKGISGQVIVQFVVSKEGEIQKAKVVRGIGGGCNEEALRIVNSMPNWNPAMHNGRTVPVTFTLPIKFSL